MLNFTQRQTIYSAVLPLLSQGQNVNATEVCSIVNFLWGQLLEVGKGYCLGKYLPLPNYAGLRLSSSCDVRTLVLYKECKPYIRIALRNVVGGGSRPAYPVCSVECMGRTTVRL